MDYELELIGRNTVADGTMEFIWSTAGTDFAFRAGQYSDFTLLNPPETDAEGNTRPFSLAGSPNDMGKIRFVTRMRDTAFKRVLKTMPLGTKVKVTKPMGSFVLPKHTERPLLFIAGGIGVTPMHSMILYASEEKLPYKIYLFCSNRTAGSTTFLAEFEKLAETMPNFKFIPTITDSGEPDWKYERGSINEEMLTRHEADLDKVTTYVAGPPAMVTDFLPILGRAGVDEDFIKAEEFAGY